MATVPTGYYYYDASAKKGYWPGETMPKPGDGDYMIPATDSYDSYYHQYEYHSSYTIRGGITYKNCWTGFVLSRYRGRPTSEHRLPYSYIYSSDYPTIDFSYYNAYGLTSSPTKNHNGTDSTISAKTNLKELSFINTGLTTAPDLPTSLTSVNECFRGTKITSPPSNFSSLLNLVNADYCFSENAYFNLNNSNKNFMAGLTKLTSIKNMFWKCTSLSVSPELPNNVTDMTSAFNTCTNLVTAPIIKSKVTNMAYAFKGCTKLTGNVKILSSKPSSYTDIFKSTTKQIILLWSNPSGSDSNYNYVKRIANDSPSNVFCGVYVQPSSFTSIRGDYDQSSHTFTETVKGTYCKLTISFTSPYVSSALLRAPTLEDENEETVSIEWHLNAINGTTITNEGVSFPISSGMTTSGTIIGILNLGSDVTAKTYTAKTRGKYVVDGESYGVLWPITTTFTHADAIIDINPLGNGVGFWTEVDDGFSGLHVNKQLTANNNEEVGIFKGIFDTIDTSVSPGTLKDYNVVEWYDKNGNFMGCVNAQHRTTGEIVTSLAAKKVVGGENEWNILRCFVDSTGNKTYAVSSPANFRKAIDIDDSGANHLRIGQYHICWGDVSISCTANSLTEVVVNLPYTYTSAPNVFTSFAARNSNARTTTGTQGGATGGLTLKQIYVGAISTSTRNQTVHWMTIGT